ncbi:MAG: SUF system NifU family Fe-S cluster assembly protein [Bacilli bacterium]|nr:SUF system NifU family Fe-S cluster assembly protein [Bacilli bacterium]
MPFSIKDDPMMLRNIIMDHYQSPRNKRATDDPRYLTIHMKSSSCVDDIYIQILYENDIVVDCLWHGVGCAISTAATSIMSELVKGKTKKEVEYIIDNYNKMLQAEPFDEEALGEAIAFINTNRQPSRIGCATIGWRGLKDLLEGKKEEDE